MSAVNITGGNSDGDIEIYAVNGDGTGLVQLTSTTSFINGFGIQRAWLSANGTTVVFGADVDPLGTNADRTREIFVVGFDGSGLRQLTFGQSLFGSFTPTITADGRQIVFQSFSNDRGRNREETLQIFLINSDGSALRQLTTGLTVVHLVNTATAEETKKLSGHGGWVKATAFSPKGGILATGGEDKNVNLWDIETGKKLQTFSGHQSEIGFLVFSTDGSLLASLDSGTNVTRQGHQVSITVGPKDKSLRFWEIKTGKEMAHVEEPDGISHVSLSSDSTLMATSSSKDAIQLWSIKRE